eukprot:scaffold31860_cov49-Attheya_sp.AAC.3
MTLYAICIVVQPLVEAMCHIIYSYALWYNLYFQSIPVERVDSRRLANLTTGQQFRGRPSMHDKSIITENYTTFGSYNLLHNTPIFKGKQLTARN